MGFLEILKKPEVRKLFGKRELAIIEKQLLGVSLSQSEKNRLSRDIRKKFEAIKALAPFVEEFELKKGSEIRKLVEEAKEIILESRFHPKIKLIALYGSAVENKLSLSSDIDIAVEFSDFDLGEVTQFRKQVLAKVNARIDVQVYNFLPSKVKKAIDSKGRILYERTNSG
ncbi:MAG TPA: nucleotidyltransferase domain-containing protein [Candidatus Norongarragalinales archaeon]|nr:nucleotidyltransferase domain-containing protein [Candidatus Norongarragalinales archaeon]